MYRCDECEKVFIYPKVISEYRGECFGFASYENIGVCPICGNDCFDKILDDDVTEEELLQAKEFEEQAELEAMYEYYLYKGAL